MTIVEDSRLNKNLKFSITLIIVLKKEGQVELLQNQGLIVDQEVLPILSNTCWVKMLGSVDELVFLLKKMVVVVDCCWVEPVVSKEQCSLHLQFLLHCWRNMTIKMICFLLIKDGRCNWWVTEMMITLLILRRHRQEMWEETLKAEQALISNVFCLSSRPCVVHFVCVRLLWVW